jgi:transcriptional regulator with XRE-family HTH domain
MVNTDDFIKRLEQILDYYNLNASSFADKIGVQRSSMSHLLSGRNKPSLDFILKIAAIFPDVDLYWILNGKGSFPKIIDPNDNPIIPDSKPPTSIDMFSVPPTPADNIAEETISKKDSKYVNHENTDEIEKIVFFYKNGTFKIFTPDSV